MCFVPTGLGCSFLSVCLSLFVLKKPTKEHYGVMYRKILNFLKYVFSKTFILLECFQIVRLAHFYCTIDSSSPSCCLLVGMKSFSFLLYFCTTGLNCLQNSFCAFFLCVFSIVKIPVLFKVSVKYGCIKSEMELRLLA